MAKKEISSKIKEKPKNKKGATALAYLAPYLFMGIELLLGIMALVLTINNELEFAGKIILIIMVIAGLEYQWRKISQGPSSFEDEFSTLTDILCFSLVPALLIYQLAFRGWGVLSLITLFVIVFSGMVRLSLYRIYNPVDARQSYVGLPLSINAAFIALITQVLSKSDMIPDYRLLLLVVIMVLAFLTVSPLRYPNPAEKFWVIIVSALAVGALFLETLIKQTAVVGLLIAGVGYLVIGPLWMKIKKIQKA